MRHGGVVKSGSGHQARSKATQLCSPHGAKSSLSNRQWLSPGAPAQEQQLVDPDPGAGEGCLRSKVPSQGSAGAAGKLAVRWRQVLSASLPGRGMLHAWHSAGYIVRTKLS